MEKLLMRYVYAVVLTCLIFAPAESWAEGEVKNLKDFQYWDNGKVRQCTVYEAATGLLMTKAFCASDGTVEKIERYDKYGNRTEQALFNSKGSLRTGIDGWAAMRWWYDGSQLVSQISYDEFGKPIERKQYSESGALLFRQYRDDGSVNPYENAAMYMMLGGRNVAYYDPSGTLEETTRLMKE